MTGKLKIDNVTSGVNARDEADTPAACRLDENKAKRKTSKICNEAMKLADGCRHLEVPRCGKFRER